MTTRKLVDLEADLHEAATGQTGLVDFGDPGYRHALRVLLEAFDIDLKLTDTGSRFAYDTFLVPTLIARLHTQTGWVEHPEVLAIPIHRPLVIIGFPRTGTTALHRLLSVDPQFQGLEHWLAQTPMMRPSRETWETHPAYLASVAKCEMLNAIIPELRSAHDTLAFEVEECGALLRQSFMYDGFSHLLPTYDKWFLAQSKRESYRRYADVLRLIGGNEPNRRWLLKDPNHIAQIDTLMDVFPDACLIQTHRDPRKVVPSLCSLVHMWQRALEGEASCASLLGPRECAYLHKTLDRIQAVRRKSPSQFFDVDHRRFLANPLGTVRDIYEYFGLDLSAHSEQLMREWVAATPPTRHGGHRYTNDPYGITDSQICATFAEYRAQQHFD
jgi:hypothetical protein